MNKKIALGIGLAVIILACVVGVFAFFGWYPIAMVNGTPIMAYQYNTSFKLAYNYYLHYSPTSTQMLLDELRPIVMEGLIDRTFIDSQLAKQMKSSELSQKISDQTGIVLNDADARQKLLDIVKVSESDVRKYFLNDKVKYQLLDGQLRLEGSDANTWLLSERRKAGVRFFTSEFSWNGAGVDLVKK